MKALFSSLIASAIIPLCCVFPAFSADAPESQLEKDADSVAQLGIANPKGGDYREVEVSVSSIWGASGFVKTHGWVMPSGKVICWNGQEYDAKTTGSPADVDKDIESMLKTDRERLEEEKRARPKFPPMLRWRDSALPEDSAVSFNTCVLNKVPILVLLGKKKLAASLMDEFYSGAESDSGSDGKRDLYVELAEPWIWSLYERALCAHMQGFDQLAFELTRKAHNALRDGDARLKRSGDGAMQKLYEPTISQLLADQTRRKTAKPDAQGNQTDKLIAAFDQIKGHQWGQPGGWSFESDPLKPVVAVGDEAVKPLLKCLRADNRLTRIVWFPRDFMPKRHVVGVAQIAEMALSQILQRKFEYYSLDTQNEREKLADEISAYYAKFKDTMMEERWYKQLADDTEQPAHWVEAAQHIVEQTAEAKDDQCQSCLFNSASEVTDLLRQRKPLHFRGERLRAKSAPSVSDLLSRRAFQVRRQGDRWGRQFDVTLINVLAVWDGKNRLADLQKFSREMTSTSLLEAEQAACLYEVRQALGDQTALDEYLKLIVRTKPKDRHDGLFGMLVRNYSNRRAKEIAQWMFAGDGSLWNAAGHSDPSYFQSRFWTSQLLALPPYRLQILKLLQNDAVLGTIIVSKEGDVSTQIGEETTYFNSRNCTGSSCTFPGETVTPGKSPLRVKYSVAQKLSEIRGFPEFRLEWPIEKKDAALREIRQALQHFAPDIERAILEWKQGAALAFPKLTAPATAQQVAKGEAIFSLDGSRQKRVIPMKFPVMAQLLDEHGKEIHDHQIDACVWQAEEVSTPSGKQRFYGVVGEHFVKKMPASRLELFNE